MILIFLVAIALSGYMALTIWPNRSFWFLLAWQNRQAYRIHYDGVDDRLDTPGIILAQGTDVKMASLLKRITTLPVYWISPTPPKLNPLQQQLLKNAKVFFVQKEAIGNIKTAGLILIDEQSYQSLADSIKPSWLACLLGSVPRQEKKFHPIRRELQLSLCHVTESEPPLSKAMQYFGAQAWARYVDKLPQITELWLAQAKKGGKRLSLVDSTGVRLSHHRLLAAVITLQHKLLPLLAGNERVGICLPAGVGAVTSILSLLMLGKVLVHLNYTASLSALKTAIDESGINTMITSKRFVTILRKKGFPIDALFAFVTPIYLEDIKASMGKIELLKNYFLAKFAPRAYLKLQLISAFVPEQTRFILFSSGSEGKPKGIELSERNIIANVHQVSTILETQGDDVMLSVLPIFHGFGLTATTLLPLVAGMTLVCHPDPTDTKTIGSLAQQYQATILCGTSTFLRFYARAKELRMEMFSSLRVVVAGAERLQTEVRILFEEKFKKTILEGYGTTELSPVASVNLPDTPFAIRHKIGSVGLPIPGCVIRIVDPDTGVDLPLETPGLVLVGGVNVMKGYLNAPLQSKEVLLDEHGLRWYKTGDKGQLDAHGFLSILDRYSRFAKLGGEAVSLGAVEQQIHLILQADPIEILALAVPDPKKGERILLLHAGPLDSAEIQAKIDHSNMHNLLKPFHYLRVEFIPKLASGKTDFAAAKALLSINF